MSSLLLVGLDSPETEEISHRIDDSVIAYEVLPRIKVDNGKLLVELPHIYNSFVPVSKVVFHGIFEDDFPFICALALWRGRCLPNAKGMMDCRQKLPCLVRALEVTRFGTMLRGFVDQGNTIESDNEMVAKWGDWHCGENKERFQGRYAGKVPTIVEPFIQGENVRVIAIGRHQWQIRMAGENWLKSIHHPDAALMPVDSELLEDTLRLRHHFGLELVAVDYIVGADGTKHLLEVNQIPNVTRFPEIRAAYLSLVAEWVRA